MVTVKVGCCGFPVSLKKYALDFSLAEVQKTFYKPPRMEILEKWRGLAPLDFEFTVKAWQVITHSCESPTWRKAKLRILNPERYGSFKPTRENLDAWDLVRRVCETLRTDICILQTPPSFIPSDENVENMRRFLTLIDRGPLELAWEPRGGWNSRPELVMELCRSLGLIHVVDLLRRDPLHHSSKAYIRLHGLGGGEVNYAYKYGDDDLKLLASKLDGLAENGVEECYILFNNKYMMGDALRFKGLLSRRRGLFHVL
ncbi:MAG: DUF72 domain-containing protein [Candidatus Bathyarchaeia archaeon]